MKHAVTVAAICSIWGGAHAQGRVQGTQPPEYLEYVRLAHAELVRAENLIKEGKYDEASAVLKPAIEQYGDGTMGLRLRRGLGEIAIRQGRLKEALTLMPRQSDGQWGTQLDYATIGFLEASVGDQAVSKAMWDAAGPVEHLKKDQLISDDWPDPNSIDGLKSAWLLMIAKLASLDDQLGQEFYLGLVRKLDPGNAILNFELACVAGGKKDFLRAERLFEKAGVAAHNHEFRQFCQRKQGDMKYQRILREQDKGA